MRKPAKTFKDLIVWQKAHECVLELYDYTKDLPQSELYGLTSQFRRAAVSIAENIAEGFKKQGKRDKARFLIYISRFTRRMQIVYHSVQGFGIWKSIRTG